MRPRVYQIDTPIIQKYTAQRLSAEGWVSKFKDLTSDDVSDLEVHTFINFIFE